MTIDLRNIPFDEITNEDCIAQDITLTVARFDKIHEEVSGNKLFKLHYFVEDCLNSTHKTLLTFGGAFSNHLAATAFLCKLKGLKCIGIVRGEEPLHYSHTLTRCKELGMALHFIGRTVYKNIDNDEATILQLHKTLGDFTFVPEGGYNATGANGASLIMHVIKDRHFSHVCTCAGTATTLAGLLLKKEPDQKIVAVPVIKNMLDIPERLKFLGVAENSLPEILNNYHFGGYAKKTAGLISFMNSFYTETGIPTDFVYTAKLMYAITQEIKNGYFKNGSAIVCLHTGGLQGNKSLPHGTLIF
ncbi:MAG: 1-aminocyclopropane-1-carboxylate deaminase/D-cysteine desulfhydrase [Ferruginibacter sp.]